MSTPSITEIVRDIDQVLGDVDRIAVHGSQIASDRQRGLELADTMIEIDALRRSIRSELLTLSSVVEGLESDASRDRQVPVLDEILSKDESA